MSGVPDGRVGGTAGLTLPVDAVARPTAVEAEQGGSCSARDERGVVGVGSERAAASAFLDKLLQPILSTLHECITQATAHAAPAAVPVAQTGCESATPSVQQVGLAGTGGQLRFGRNGSKQVSWGSGSSLNSMAAGVEGWKEELPPIDFVIEPADVELLEDGDIGEPEPKVPGEEEDEEEDAEQVNERLRVIGGWAGE